MTRSTLWTRATLLPLLLPALTTVIGLQTLRVWASSLVWYLRDSAGAPSTTLGLYALATFALPFFAGLVWRLLGGRRALWLTAGGLAVVRLAEQVSTSAPVDLGLTTVGVVLFAVFFPVYLGLTRSWGTDATVTFGLGVLLGFSFDIALQGLFQTIDLSWQPGIVPLLVVAVLAAAQVWLVTQAGDVRVVPVEPAPRRRPKSQRRAASERRAAETTATANLPTIARTDASVVGNLPLLALGPALFLAGVVLQNPARATGQMGWTLPLGLGWLIVVNALNLTQLSSTLRNPARTYLLLLIALTILGAWTVWNIEQGVSFMFAVFIANALLFVALTLVFAGLGAAADRPGIGRAALVNGVGWLVFAVLAFMYYVSYYIAIGVANLWLPVAAAVVVGALALFALRPILSKQFIVTQEQRADWAAAVLTLACLVVPLVLWPMLREPAPVAGQGFPVRVMQYNIHSGFNTAGRLDLEAIAQTIEQGKPDIVGLQEVARGWYIDSGSDAVGWLSRRLGLPYIFGPTTDPVWGNVLLSRFPIKESGREALPPSTLLLRRGFTWATIDVGAGQDLLFIVTHYHHLENGSAERQQQSPEIIKFWNNRPRTVFVGDLNATPDAPEIRMLRDAGLKDAFAAVGQGNGYTYASDEPYQRIDYIWTSPDLAVRDLVIPASTASDHLGLAVTVDLAR